jgi:SAM-dependent methyltransferase
MESTRTLRWQFEKRRTQMSFVSAAPEHLSYYDLQLDHPDWEHATVLDFGGNRGNALMAGRIKASDYWCIDVSRDAIEQGRRDYPEAHWIFYDRYNFRFNPAGIPGLPIPELGRKFDYVLAYSVFTHTHDAEMVELVGHLRKLVAENGCLAFSFVDPHFVLPRDYSSLLRDHNPPTNLGLRLERSKLINPNLPVQQRLREAAGANWCALVDHDALYIGAEDKGGNGTEKTNLYTTFCTAQYMSQIFPEAAILPPPQVYEPQQCDRQELPMQHCCILKGSGGSVTHSL